MDEENNSSLGLLNSDTISEMSDYETDRYNQEPSESALNWIQGHDIKNMSSNKSLIIGKNKNDRDFTNTSLQNMSTNVNQTFSQYNSSDDEAESVNEIKLNESDLEELNVNFNASDALNSEESTLTSNSQSIESSSSPNSKLFYQDLHEEFSNDKKLFDQNDMFVEARNILKDDSDDFKYPFGANHANIDEAILENSKSNYHFAENDNRLLNSHCTDNGDWKVDKISNNNLSNILPSHSTINMSSYMRQASEPLGSYGHNAPTIERPHFGISSHIKTPAASGNPYALYDSGDSSIFHQSPPYQGPNKILETPPKASLNFNANLQSQAQGRVKFCEPAIVSPCLSSKYFKAKGQSDSLLDFTMGEGFREDFNLRAGKMSTPLIAPYTEKNPRNYEISPSESRQPARDDELDHIYHTIKKIERRSGRDGNYRQTIAATPTLSHSRKEASKLHPQNAKARSDHRKCAPSSIAKSSEKLFENLNVNGDAKGLTSSFNGATNVASWLDLPETLFFRDSCCVHGQILADFPLRNRSESEITISELTCYDTHPTEDCYKSFSLHNCPNPNTLKIAPQSSIDIEILFRPKRAGMLEGVLNIKMTQSINGNSGDALSELPFREHSVCLKAMAEYAVLEVEGDKVIDLGYVDVEQNVSRSLSLSNKSSCSVPLFARLFCEKPCPYNVHFTIDSGDSGYQPSLSSDLSFTLYPAQSIRVNLLLHPNSTGDEAVDLKSLPDFFRVSASMRLYVDKPALECELNDIPIIGWMGFFRLEIPSDAPKKLEDGHYQNRDVKGILMKYPFAARQSLLAHNLRRDDKTLKVRLEVFPLPQLFVVTPNESQNTGNRDTELNLKPRCVQRIDLDLTRASYQLIDLFQRLAMTSIDSTLKVKTGYGSHDLFSVPIAIEGGDRGINEPPTKDFNNLTLTAPSLSSNFTNLSESQNFQNTNFSLAGWDLKESGDLRSSQKSPRYERVGRSVAQRTLASIYHEEAGDMISEKGTALKFEPEIICWQDHRNPCKMSLSKCQLKSFNASNKALKATLTIGPSTLYTEPLGTKSGEYVSASISSPFYFIENESSHNQETQQLVVESQPGETLIYYIYYKAPGPGIYSSHICVRCDNMPQHDFKIPILAISGDCEVTLKMSPHLNNAASNVSHGNALCVVESYNLKSLNCHKDHRKGRALQYEFEIQNRGTLSAFLYTSLKLCSDDVKIHTETPFMLGPKETITVKVDVSGREIHGPCSDNILEIYSVQNIYRTKMRRFVECNGIHEVLINTLKNSCIADIIQLPQYIDYNWLPRAFDELKEDITNFAQSVKVIRIQLSTDLKSDTRSSSRLTGTNLMDDKLATGRPASNGSPNISKKSITKPRGSLATNAQPKIDEGRLNDIVISQPSLTFRKIDESGLKSRVINKLKIMNRNKLKEAQLHIGGPYLTDRGFYLKKAYQNIIIAPHKYVNLPVEFRFSPSHNSITSNRGGLEDNLDVFDSAGHLIQRVRLVAE